MKIVVLDGHTLNPGDLSWESLQQLGECEIHARTAPGDVAQRAGEAAIVLTNKTPLPADAIAGLGNLRYIGVLATGFNVVDTAAARARGIPVTNVPAYGTRSVAQHTLALLLELTNGVGRHAESVRGGKWTQNPDFCFWEQPLVELDGKVLGIVGGGRIGQAVAQLAGAFGLTVRIATRTDGRAGLERVLRESDVVSLHVPLTPDTKEMINAETLGWMRPSAFLINTSRGQLINEADLAAALNADRLAGVAVDVLSVEPPPTDHPLLKAKHCLVTPHNAWATQAARSRLMDIAVANIRNFQAGQLTNVVN